MIKFRAILSAFFVFFLSGCVLKTTSKSPDMYEIYYSKDRCNTDNNLSKNIYIHDVKALDIVDNRQILIISERNFIRYLDDIKYATLPSDMFYKAIFKGIYLNCNAKPVFDIKNSDMDLKVELVSLHIRGDKAEVSLAYELNGTGKIIKSGLITKTLFCENPSSFSIFNTINKASNMAIDALLLEILN